MTTDDATWQDVAPPVDAPAGTTATRRVHQQNGGAVETETITTYLNPSSQVLDDHVVWMSTAADGTVMTHCTFQRRHYYTDTAGPSVKTTGLLTLTEKSPSLTWQLTFTDTTGAVARQLGTTTVHPDHTHAQSVATTFPDGSAKQEHLSWTDPSTATCRTLTLAANEDNPGTTVNATMCSDGQGPWTNPALTPIPPNAPELDAMAPPYGARGPLVGGVVIANLNNHANPT